MEAHCTNRLGNMLALAALVALSCLSLPAAAQVADGQPLADTAAPGSRSDADPGQGETSDLFFSTHDVSGKLGTPLPLEIKLVRTGAISVESIFLLGLPRGVTISDSNNTFSPSDDTGDVDIRAWDLPNIKISQSDEREKRFSLAIAAIWTAASAGKTNVATSLVNVSFRSEAPERTIAAGEKPPSPESLRLPSPEQYRPVRSSPTLRRPIHPPRSRLS